MDNTLGPKLAAALQSQTGYGGPQRPVQQAQGPFYTNQTNPMPQNFQPPQEAMRAVQMMRGSNMPQMQRPAMPSRPSFGGKSAGQGGQTPPTFKPF